MRWTRLLTSLTMVLMAVEIAHAQAGLGAPLPPERATDTQRPILGGITRTLTAPFRTTLMPPQSMAELSPPIPTREELARMIADGSYSPAEIFAAKIKIDETHVKYRQAAVRYLASVDCHYNPEAEAGLIGALRTDRSESVRYEAAVALGSCRGATRRMVDALTISALGHETDGNPSETSERVRTAARISLTRALASAVAQYPQEYVSLVHVTPKTDPTGMQSIMPISRLPEPAISPEERRRAETVGIPARQPQPTGGVRSISDWFQIIAWWRRPSSQADVDPRLRGLQPLGSDGTLAIPVSP